MNKMAFLPEEQVALARKLMNRTGYKDAPRFLMMEAWNYVMVILSGIPLTVSDLRQMERNCQLSEGELDYYCDLIRLREKY